MTRFSQDDAPTPVYYQVQQAIKEEIESGRLGPHEAIPPERTLVHTYGASLGTIRKAILNLVAEGYLYRNQGRGTFVAGTTLKRGTLRYYRLLRRFKDSEAALGVKCLEICNMPGDAEVNTFLDLRKNQKLFRIKRLFLLDETPTVYTDSYLPASIFPRLDKLSIDQLEKETLYHVIEKVYGMPTLYNHELFSAVPAEGEAAELLEVGRGEPLLRIEMLAFTYKGRPYEYRRAYMRQGERAIYREI